MSLVNIYRLTLCAILSIGMATAFAPLSTSTSRHSIAALNAYVPDGLSPQEYAKIKANDKKKIGKDLGRLGPKGFKSRSLEAWQMAFERGETSHTFAPIGYREKVKNGTIKKEEVPYMVRGGSWDNSDLKGAKRLRWLKKDKEYATGGYKKEQSSSIIGSGPGIDWAGKRSREENRSKIVPGFN